MDLVLPQRLAAVVSLEQAEGLKDGLPYAVLDVEASAHAACGWQTSKTASTSSGLAPVSLHDLLGREAFADAAGNRVGSVPVCHVTGSPVATAVSTMIGTSFA